MKIIKLTPVPDSEDEKLRKAALKRSLEDKKAIDKLIKNTPIEKIYQLAEATTENPIKLKTK